MWKIIAIVGGVILIVIAFWKGDHSPLRNTGQAKKDINPHQN